MPIIKVTAKTDRFRRAGLAFTREPVELDTEDLSKKQLEALKSEPMLVVEEAAKSGGQGGKNGPTDPAERAAAVRAAIAKLDKSDTKAWMADGRPNLDALSAAAGFRVNAADRDQALAG